MARDSAGSCMRKKKKHRVGLANLGGPPLAVQNSNPAWPTKGRPRRLLTVLAMAVAGSPVDDAAAAAEVAEEDQSKPVYPSPEELVAKAIAPVKRDFLRPPPVRASSSSNNASRVGGGDVGSSWKSLPAKSVVQEKKSKRQLKRERQQVIQTTKLVSFFLLSYTHWHGSCLGWLLLFLHWDGILVICINYRSIHLEKNMIEIVKNNNNFKYAY